MCLFHKALSKSYIALRVLHFISQLVILFIALLPFTAASFVLHNNFIHYASKMLHSTAFAYPTHIASNSSLCKPNATIHASKQFIWMLAPLSSLVSFRTLQLHSFQSLCSPPAAIIWLACWQPKASGLSQFL